MSIAAKTLDVEKKYQEIRVLGSGGMGHTTLVERKKDKKRCVLKTIELSPEDSLPTEQSELLRFLMRESELLGTLHHPGLPKIYESFYDKKRGRYYIVMEYIEGETLEQILTKNGSIAESKIVDWAIQALRILEYLHTATGKKPIIIHRDIKPSNLMLTPEGVIKLIDFGIARTLDDKDKGSSHTKVLTFEFASPEHISGHTEPRSDLYCLGTTMKMLLTGKTPIPLDETHADLEGKSGGLITVIKRATKLAKAARYVSAKEMREALENIGKDIAKETVDTIITLEDWKRFEGSMGRVFGQFYNENELEFWYKPKGTDYIYKNPMNNPPKVYVDAALLAAKSGIPEHSRATMLAFRRQLEGIVKFLDEYKENGSNGLNPPAYIRCAVALIYELLGDTKQARERFSQVINRADPATVRENIDILLEARDGIERIDRPRPVKVSVAPPVVSKPLRTRILDVLNTKIF